MKFLIVADPVEGLEPTKDTSLAMTREAFSRGHEIHWCEAQDITLKDNRVYSWSKKVIQPELKNGFCELGSESKHAPVSDFDGVWIRKDPPFDPSYLTLCWLLSLEESRVGIANRATLLSQYHEKLLPYWAVKLGYLDEINLQPTLLSGRHLSAIQNSFGSQEIVTKPWMGYGGKGVKRHEDYQTAIQSLKSLNSHDQQLIQPVIPEVKTSGDRRLFFIGGKCLGSLVRIPKQGEIISNLASGGTAILRDFNAIDNKIIQSLERFFTKVPFHFAGVDLIHDKVTEINVTSPTGLVSLKKIGGPNLVPALIDLLEKSKPARQ